jgi:HD superfamily phosphodiesterase
MANIERLEQLVKDLYCKKNPNRDEWADWLYKKHVLVVANNAEQLAKRFNVSIEQSRAAALLHDIADAVMAREKPNHEEISIKIAKELLGEAYFEEDAIRVIVDDALPFHGCHDGVKPKTLVGKILSTADALAHLNTDFYEFAVANSQDRSDDWVKQWVTKKLPRDFYDKIAFDEVREETKERYEELLAKYT